MIPFEANLIGTPTMNSMEEIKLSKLTNPSQMRTRDIDVNCIDLQLLRIIVPGPGMSLACNYSTGKN
eukprot:5266072-Ditylum_brightwellii.AAC.1